MKSKQLEENLATNLTKVFMIIFIFNRFLAGIDIQQIFVHLSDNEHVSSGGCRRLPALALAGESRSYRVIAISPCYVTRISWAVGFFKP